MVFWIFSSERQKNFPSNFICAVIFRGYIFIENWLFLKRTFTSINFHQFQKFCYYSIIFIGKPGAKTVKNKINGFYCYFPTLCNILIKKMIYNLKLLLIKVLHLLNWFIKFDVFIIYGFAFIGESSVRRGVNSAKCQILKMHNFSSSLPKFSRHITHYKIFE